jgi:hypothetical protein
MPSNKVNNNSHQGRVAYLQMSLKMEKVRLKAVHLEGGGMYCLHGPMMICCVPWWPAPGASSTLMGPMQITDRMGDLLKRMQREWRTVTQVLIPCGSTIRY